MAHRSAYRARTGSTLTGNRLLLTATTVRLDPIRSPRATQSLPVSATEDTMEQTARPATFVPRENTRWKLDPRIAPPAGQDITALTFQQEERAIRSQAAWIGGLHD